MKKNVYTVYVYICKSNISKKVSFWYQYQHSGIISTLVAKFCNNTQPLSELMSLNTHWLEIWLTHYRSRQLKVPWGVLLWSSFFGSPFCLMRTHEDACANAHRWHIHIPATNLQEAVMCHAMQQCANKAGKHGWKQCRILNTLKNQICKCFLRKETPLLGYTQGTVEAHTQGNKTKMTPEPPTPELTDTLISKLTKAVKS